MVKFNKFKFFLVKPPNPVDHFKDGSSRKFSLFLKIENIIKDIIFREGFIKFKVTKLLSLFKLIFIISLVPIFYLPALILKKMKYRILNINYWQIGTYTQQFDLIYKLNDKDIKIICLIPKNLSSSNFFTEIVKKKFFVIENFLICLLMSPFFYFNFLNVNEIEVDEGYYGNKCFSIFNKFDSSKFYLKYINKLDLKNNFFEKYRIKNKNFCVLHVRNLGTIRDSNLEDYFSTIKYLNSKDISVIRFCENYSNINKIWKLDNFHEIQLNEQNKKFQFKIIADSKFMISNNSGPANIATILKTPLLLVNAFPYNKIFNYNEKDITLPKRIVKENYNLKLNEIFESNLSHSGSEKFLNSKKLKILNNTPTEILNTTKEFIDNLNFKEIKFFHDKKKYQKYFDLGEGNLSNFF